MHYYVIEFIVESISIPRMMGLYKIQRKNAKNKELFGSNFRSDFSSFLPVDGTKRPSV